MGANASRSPDDDYFRRDSSLRRSSRDRRSTGSSKSDQMSMASKIVGDVKSDIDNYTGNRHHERYKQLQEILTAVSKQVQNIKNKSNKQNLRDQCDEVLGEVQNCLQRLETRVSFNERDQSLDMAAVESHSFITQRIDKGSHRQDDPAYSNKAKTLEKLEISVGNLDKEIARAIEAEDVKRLNGYENEIKILYAELEMINLNEGSDLSPRKAKIGKRMIRSNNHIRQYKRGLSKPDGNKPSKPKKANSDKSLDKTELEKIEKSLEHLEVRALTFSEPKNTTAFKELEQVLENCWTKTYSVDAIGDAEREKKLELIERIKNVLRELKKRGEDITEGMEKIQVIKDDVSKIKRQVGPYAEAMPKSLHLSMDQELRSRWAKVSEVQDVSENVRKSKEFVIADIQDTLKRLSKLPGSDDQVINSQIAQAQIQKQVEEFYNHWNILKYNLDPQNSSPKVVVRLGQIAEDITVKKSSLKPIEREAPPEVKAVVVQSYHAPDLLQSRPVSHHEETEIKVQPTVKTIGEIQRIGAEAKAILQQIRESDFKKYDSKYIKFEKSLMKCKRDIDTIDFNKKSETINSSKRRASKTIAEALRCLEEKSSKLQEDQVSSIRTSRAQEVMDIDAEVQFYRQQIKNFRGTEKDKQYEKIKSGLADSLEKLQRIDDVHIPKQDNIRQIQHYHQELETKLAENQAKLKVSEQVEHLKRQTSDEVKIIIELVQKLRSQVDQFTGVHKGLFYSQIEDKLLGCLAKLDSLDTHSDEKLEGVVGEVRQKVRKYLNILEDKSIKTTTSESGEHSSSPNQQTPAKEVAKPENRSTKSDISPHQKINQLREKLITIKDKTERFSGSFKDNDYSEIEKELFECSDELKGIDHENHKSVIISKENYADYIEKLLKYFEEKVTSTEVDVNYQKTTSLSELKPKTSVSLEDPVEELRILEDAINHLKDKINNPSEGSYKEVDDEITMLMTKLNKLETGNVAHVREKKKSLAQSLYNFGLLLEEQMKKKSEKDMKMRLINEIIEKLDEVGKEIAAFSGVKNDKDYCYLDEVLISFTIKLDGLVTENDVELKSARKTAMQKILLNMKTLSERAESQSS